jgi:alpha-galactosidase
LGIFDSGTNNMKVIRGFNVGGWSTKEELPMAIVEDRSQNNFLLFQIENNGGWYYELGEYAGMLFLNLCGPNEQFGAWSKRLKPGEIFEGVRAALCYAPTLNGVLAEMTAYRRKIVLPCAADARLPPIYNEYMHGSFDNPDERNTALLAPVVAKTGAEYYIIDCGWHDEEDAVYSYIGQWKESKKRFPSGVKKTIDFLHSLGLKAGLWIEPESLGYLCGEMLARYNKECFFVKNGEKICAMGRHQLDFRHPKVREYIGGVIDRIAGEWGVDYIKIDYNQCSGAGTEVDSDSLGDGQLEHNRAYIRFIEGVRKKYPNLILEACASGGNRMDYETLRAVSLTSTSDQTDYRRYPYIVGNVFAAVLPEQAGVWSYPVDSCLFPSGGGASGNFQADFTAINRALTPDTVAFNMVNALLGRMHLASKLQYLDGEKFALVREGVSYYNKLSPFKREAVPYLPLGFTDFTRDFVCVGLKSADRLFLAVWNLGGALRAEVPLSDLKPVDVEIGYPLSSDLRYSLSGGRLVLEFARDWQSAVLEITEQA